jgi:hypothetical protein
MKTRASSDQISGKHINIIKSIKYVYGFNWTRSLPLPNGNKLKLLSICLQSFQR